MFGQRKLLKWTVPGVAHFLMFWGFIILAATILEAYGALFDRDFAIPLIGHWAVLGFLEDFFAWRCWSALADVRGDPAAAAHPRDGSGRRASTARTPARPGSCCS